MGVWFVATHLKTGEKIWHSVTAAPFLVGRKSAEDKPGKMVLAFDATLSRIHFTARWNDEKLHITREPGSKHPLFFKGEARDEFSLSMGDYFSTGSTRFQLTRESPSTGDPMTSFTIDAEQLKIAREQDSSRCLQALLRLQPILHRALEPEEFFRELLPLVAEIIHGASEVFILKVLDEMGNFDSIAHHSIFESPPHTPSRSLLRLAFETNQPGVYLWGSGAALQPLNVTTCQEIRWALATPIVAGAERFALYALGIDAEERREESKATPGEIDRAVLSLIASVVAEHLVGRKLHHLEGQLGQFFSPGLRSLILKDPHHSMLELGHRDATVLFFDLRGFSKAAERSQSGEAEEERRKAFLEHHETIRTIMTVVTECIFHTEGIVVDFQGDAVFACWGTPLAQEDHASRALVAAHMILRRLMTEFPLFKKDLERHSLPCGIGISSGSVLAGNVGIGGQVKYVVMGNCVNVASRLEGLTKYFHVPVLFTGDTHAALRESALSRRVARVRPAGMTQTITLFELIIAREWCGTGLTPDEVATYERALQAYEEGALEESERALRSISIDDPVRRFLNLRVEHALLEGVPEHWEGVIMFNHK
jgi:adenylate cyclase